MRHPRQSRPGGRGHVRIRYTDRFESPDLPGEMHISVTLKTVACGTEALALLAHLVEPDIPDGP